MPDFKTLVASAAIDAIIPPGQPPNVEEVKVAAKIVNAAHDAIPDMPVPKFTGLGETAIYGAGVNVAWEHGGMKFFLVVERAAHA